MIIPYFYEKPKRIGLNVVKIDDKLGDILLRLGMLYSEMGQRAFTDYDENNYYDNK